MLRGLGVLVLCLALAPCALAWAQDAGVDAAVPLVALAPRPSAPVAVAGTTNTPLVTAEDVAAAIDSRPSAMRGAYRDPARVDAAGDELVRDRLLADEARATGLDDTPDARREVDRVLARLYAERAVAAAPHAAPTPAEIQAFYDAHQAEYTKPEQARVLGVPLDTRAEAEAVARALRGASERAVRASARRHAHGRRLRESGGELGWVFAGSGDEPAVVQAALALAQPGATSAAVVTAERFWVLYLLEKRPPEPIPVADLTQSIATRIERERERAVVEAESRRLSRERRVTVTPASRVVRMEPVRP